MDAPTEMTGNYIDDAEVLNSLFALEHEEVENGSKSEQAFASSSSPDSTTTTDSTTTYAGAFSPLFAKREKNRLAAQKMRANKKKRLQENEQTTNELHEEVKRLKQENQALILENQRLRDERDNHPTNTAPSVAPG